VAIRASGLWLSVVHDAPAADARPTGLWATVVHDAPADARPTGLWATVVHDAPAIAQPSGLWLSVVHDATPPPPGAEYLTGQRQGLQPDLVGRFAQPIVPKIER
jgi:hypothetical protein